MKFYINSARVTCFRVFPGLVLLSALLGFQSYQPEQASGGDGIKAIVSPDFAYASRRGTWRVSMVLETDPIVVGGGIKVRFVKGFKHATSSKNYVQVETSNKLADLQITQRIGNDSQVPWDWDSDADVVTALVQKNSLSRGDSIHMIFGTNAPKGWVRAPQAAFTDSILIACDFEGDGIYYELAQKPAVTVLPGPSYRLTGTLPSIIAIDKPAKLNIVVIDEYSNPQAHSVVQLI